MTRTDPLREWRSIVGLVEARIADVAAAELDRRPRDSMTLRETVHHIVEANIVAASIVVSALGSPGCTYDWSWMMPFGPWMDRLRYDRQPVDVSLRLLRALNDWVAAVIEPLPDGLQREVRLRDAPDAGLRTATVAEVLLQEAEHARGHLPPRPATR
jgi:hypothetical protein